jgi:adenylyl cyclase-associated protein
LKWSGSDASAEKFYNNALANLGSVSSVSAPEEAKVAPAKAAPAAPVKKAVPAKKEPVKLLKFKTWEISNYGAETITFKGDEVQVGMTFNFFNCEKTIVIIEGKCKNIMMSKCKKVDLKVDETMSMIEVIGGEAIKIRVEKKVPTVSIERSNGVVVICNMVSKKNVGIAVTASQSVSF